MSNSVTCFYILFLYFARCSNGNIFFYVIVFVFVWPLSLCISAVKLMHMRTANWPRDLALCCMSPPPCLAGVSVGLLALDSCLLAFGLIDVVCLGPVSLFPGLSPFRWIDIVCLGLSSSSLGCLLPALTVDYDVHVCVPGLLVYALDGLSILPASLHRLPLYDTPPMVICSGTEFLW